jgi:4-amino-4-deoxy-L-arabinose transferase-like glycosyltransferase
LANRTAAAVWLVACGLVALALLLLGLVLTYPLSHDEQQYVAGASLIFDAQIYRDFMYIQTPYWALVLGPVIELVSERPFLVSRLVNWILSSASLLVLYLVARQGGASRPVAFGAAALFASSSVMEFSFGTARNDILPLLCTLLACYFYLRASAAQSSAKYWFFAAGVVLAGAVGTKISFAFAPVAFVGFSLVRQWYERTQGFWRTELVPLVAGGVVGALPMIALALPSLENFWYDVVQYHATATLDWYGEYDAATLRLPYQLQLFVRLFLRSDATLAATIWLVAAIGIVATAVTRQRLGADRGRALLPAVLLAVGLPFAFLPRPSWVQYFAPLVPLVILAPIFLLGLLPRPEAKRNAPLAVGVIVLGSLSGLGNHAVDFLRATRGDNWTTTQVQRFGAEVDAALGDRSGVVITLGPIHVLEGGRSFAPELVLGPQFFRDGDALDSATIRRLGAVSPNTLGELVERTRATAILVGVDTVDRYRDVEAPLKEYAAAHGYTPVAIEGPPAATLFLAPAR